MGHFHIMHCIPSRDGQRRRVSLNEFCEFDRMNGAANDAGRLCLKLSGHLLDALRLQNCDHSVPNYPEATGHA